jgi:hypothetical protein
VKLSGLPGREVHIASARLAMSSTGGFVGRTPPTTATLLGMDEGMDVLPPTDINGAGDVASGIVSSGRCVSPPTSHLIVDMLELERFQEEPQNNGVHATFGGPDDIPECDDAAAFFMEAAFRAEQTYRHVPRRRRSFSTKSTLSLATCVPGNQASSTSCATLVDLFPFGFVPEDGSAVPVMGAYWAPTETGEGQCPEWASNSNPLHYVVTSAAQWSVG